MSTEAEELVELLTELDGCLCTLLDDVDGKSLAIENLREGEKIIAYICHAWGELGSFAGIDGEEMRRVCERAYNRWKTGCPWHGFETFKE